MEVIVKYIEKDTPLRGYISIIWTGDNCIEILYRLSSAGYY